ncbi:MAG: transposase, partial [Acidobacteriota bacterium]|nr:transposase [Acidobacteriota bacterium]
LVDTIGLPVALCVTAASKSDQAGAKSLFAENKEKLKNLKKIRIDGTYRGEKWHKQVAEEYGIELEVSKNPEGIKGFIAQAKRWLVERTFGWFIQSRRLTREYEKLTESSQAMLYLSMIRILLRRLA